jgi:NRPS condensation-like uncharacterized protein
MQRDIPPESPYFELSPADEAMAALDYAYPSLIHVVIDLDGGLDLARLAAAWRLLPERHPILGAVASRHGRSWRWRAAAAEPSPPIEHDEPGAAPGPEAGPVEAAYLGRTLDIDSGPVARLLVFRRSGSVRLVVTVHHAAMDARAVVQVADDLRRIYVDLESRPDLRPVADDRPRTMDDVVRRTGFPMPRLRTLFGRASVSDVVMATSWHAEPRPDRQGDTSGQAYTYEGVFLDRELMCAVAQVRRARGWTVNDVMLGLLAGCWERVFETAEPGPRTSGWIIPADLRPQLGVSGGAGVLSGLAFVALPGIDGDRPLDAVETAHAVMAGLKSSFPGLGSQVQLAALQAVAPRPLFDAIFRAGHRHRTTSKRYGRVFTNVGVLPESLGDWGASNVLGAYVVAPAGSPPSTIVTGSSFRGALTLTFGHGSGWIPRAQADALGHALREELIDLGCDERAAGAEGLAVRGSRASQDRPERLGLINARWYSPALQP